LGKWIHAFLERVLPRPIYRALRAIENFIVEILLQRILGTIALLIVYVFVIGPTSLTMRLFFIRNLRKPTVSLGSDWVSAEHYQPDLERSYFQS
jgi:hypothetical protein